MKRRNIKALLADPKTRAELLKRTIESIVQIRDDVRAHLPPKPPPPAMN